MNNVYVEIVLTVAPDQALRELISFQLHEWGFTGFLEDDLSIHCFLPKPHWNENTQHRLGAFLAEQEPASVVLSSIAEVANENWNRKWEETILPIEVGDQFVIAPSWHPVPASAGKVVVTIDPKMSFGTGYHESTRLMLRMIEKHGTARAHVLDVGTGTGILAIAAAKLGSVHVVGIDTDEWSYTNARENVEKNGCNGVVEIHFGSLEVVAETGFDMILANITRTAILELLPSLVQKLRKEGALLCSGLMIEDRTSVEDALRNEGCTLLSGATENEWIGIAAQRE